MFNTFSYFLKTLFSHFKFSRIEKIEKLQFHYLTYSLDLSFLALGLEKCGKRHLKNESWKAGFQTEISVL